MRASIERRLVRHHIRMIKGGHPVQRRPQADGLKNRRGAGLEFMRSRIVGDPIAGHDLDHLAATLIRPRPVQGLRRAIQRADAGRSIQLVPGHDIPVAAQRLDIDLQMHGSLTAVSQNFRADLMGQSADFCHVRHRAKHIAHMRQGNHARLRTDSPRQVFHVQRTVRVQANPFQHGPVALPQEMPGHDIGVMFHHRQNDFIPWLDTPCQRGGNKVDAFRRALGENYVLRTRCIQEFPDFLTRRFIGLGGLVRQRMNAPMDIRIGRARLVRDPVDDGVRLLRAGRIVQIDQRLAVDLPRQDRKFCPDGTNVERPAHALASHVSASPRSTSSSAPASSRASATKACVSKARAVFSGIPRWRM